MPRILSGDRRRPLLTNNNENLKRDGIWVWSLPAYLVKLSDGRVVNTCPAAGACAAMCYAVRGSYSYSNVLEAHIKHLELVINDLPMWEELMMSELSAPKFWDKHVRIHDGGDFFSDAYLESWMRIAEANPRTTFYAYTKEVERFKRLVEGKASPNLLWLYSLGGTQDRLIDREKDRYCSVFDSEEAIVEAGFESQSASDLMAIYLPTNRVGIVVNNNRQVINLLAGGTFESLQESREDRARLKKAVPAKVREPKPRPEEPDRPKTIDLDMPEVRSSRPTDYPLVTDRRGRSNYAIFDL